MRLPISKTMILLTTCALTTAVVACSGGGGGGNGDEPPAGSLIYGVDAANTLVSFGSENPNASTQAMAITGLETGETVVGIDFRPVGGLYALTSDSRVYTVNTLNGAALVVGTSGNPFTPALAGTDFGWDFNPTVDRIRVHGGSGQNLRIVPTTAVAILDTSLTFAVGDANAAATANIVATAYTNSVAGATSTTLFALDAGLDVLTTFAAPNTGKMTTVGALGVDTTTSAGFDIDGTGGAAFAALTVGNQPGLYSIDLTSGVATRIEDIDHPSPLVGISVAP